MTDLKSETAPLQGLPLVIAIMTIAAANFMSFLDMTIANVALPPIAGGLGVTPHEGVWTITSYAVAEAIAVPLTGWVVGRYGSVRVFIAASFAFGLFSLVCGLSTTLAMLVAGRILQGLAGGFLVPVSQVLLQTVVPPKHASLGVTVWGLTALTAPVFGPLLGGLFCDTWGWQWCFFINVPVAAICVIVAMSILPKDRGATARSRMDYVGLGLLVLWVGAFQITLDTGEQNDWFNSFGIILLIATALAGLAVFVIWELTDDAPIVDLRVFRHRGFTVATIVMFVAFACIAAYNVVFVLWLQMAIGYPAIWTGYAMTYISLLPAVVAPLIGFLMTRVDSRLLISGGLFVMGGTFLCRVGYASNMPFEGLAFMQAMTGMSGTFYFVPIMGMAVAMVDREEMASAAGLFNFARTLSMAFGSAVGIALWTRIAAMKHADLAGMLNAPDTMLAGAPRLGVTMEQARGLIESGVQTEALMLATNQMFLLMGLATCASSILIWLAPKPAGQFGDGARPLGDNQMLLRQGEDTFRNVQEVQLVLEEALEAISSHGRFH